MGLLFSLDIGNDGEGPFLKITIVFNAMKDKT